MARYYRKLKALIYKLIAIIPIVLLMTLTRETVRLQMLTLRGRYSRMVSIYKGEGTPNIIWDYGENKTNNETRINEVIRRYDLRIIVIVYDRAHSLIRLLNSLNAAEYGSSESIKLEVWIDRSEEGNVNGPTLQAAQTFKFKHGEYEISSHPQHVGIYGQWFTTWKPDANSSEIAVILEDDLTVSKYFWRYLKVVHKKYDKNTDINGFSLQGYTITFSNKRKHKILNGTKGSFVFLYPVIGAWGFSPSTKNWIKFLFWLKSKDIAKAIPYVPDNIATDWYEDMTRNGKANTMWEIWHIYYAWLHMEYTLYCNFQGHAGLTTNWREKGLHSKKTEGSSNALLTEWKTEYENLPDNIAYLDIEGNVIRR